MFESATENLFRRLRFGLLVILFWPQMSATASAAGSLVLTNAAQVRALTKDEAAKPLPVRLHGVTVWSLLDDLALVDETSGIYCYGGAIGAAGLHPGDVVEVEGVTDPGHFAPYVLAQAAHKVGDSKIPEPARVTYDDLRGGSWDGQWVRIIGVVRESGPRDKAFPADADWKITLATGGARLFILLSREQGEHLKAGSKIEFSGVCFYQFNEFRQVVRPVLAVDRSERIVVLSPAPEDPFKLPISPIETLLEFNPDGMQGRYAHLQGMVVQSEHGTGFWISDGEQGAHVLTGQRETPDLGDRVDVIGFLNSDQGFPILEDARYHITGKSPAMAPIQLKTPEQAQKHNGALVQLEASILSLSSTMEGSSLELETGSNRFAALWPGQVEKLVPSTWQPGARVRVTGICVAAVEIPSWFPGRVQLNSLKLILRSPTDIQIIHPGPWWTARHTVWVLGMVVGALLLVLAGLFGLARHRLRQQAIARMKAETEFAAVFNERNRMARELHDTLAQGLSAISVELEVVKRRLPDPAAARESLEIASQIARVNLKEARSWIWNMRSQVLETGDLATALADVLRNLTDGTKTTGTMRIRGTTRQLAPVTENNVLRIGQEAITNAAKYAQARTLQVTLEFDERQMRLIVADDGKGFDVAHPPASEGGFGLMGMRERAAQLHAELTVTSEPGEGTILTLSVPLPHESACLPEYNIDKNPADDESEI